MTTKASKGTARRTLSWGLQPPGDVEVAWGARAIYDTRLGMRSVDLLPDRQAGFGPADSVRAICDWYNKRGRAMLLAELSAQDVQPGDACYLELHEQGKGVTWHLHASPRASHGYLYLVAWADYRTDRCEVCGAMRDLLRYGDMRICTSCHQNEVVGPRCAKPDCTSDEVYERTSLGIYAGRWCEKHWQESGYRKEGREGYDWFDAGEAYDPEDY